MRFCIRLVLCRAAPLALAIAALLSLTIQDACAGTVTIDPGEDYYELGAATSWLRDKQGLLGIHDVVVSPDFTDSEGAPSFGYTSDTVWLKVSLKQTYSKEIDWVLDLSPAFLDKIDIYRADQDNVVQIASLGDHRPWQNDWHWRHAAIIVQLPANRSVTYYFRIESSSSVAFSPVLYRSDVFPEAVTAQTLVVAAATTGGLMTMAFALLFFLLLRDQLYLYLLLYVCAFTYCVAMFEGLLHFILRPSHPIILEWLQVILQSIGMFALFRFSSLLLDLPGQLPRVAHIADKVVIGISTLGILLLLAGHYSLSIPLLWAATAGICLAAPVAAFALAPRIGLTGYLYGFSFAVITLGSAFRFSWIFGTSAPGTLSETSLPTTIFVHIVLLFITLALRYIRTEKALIANNIRSLQRITEASKRLQEIVSEKTSQLNETNVTLSKQLQHSRRQRARLKQIRDRLRIALDEEKEAHYAQNLFMQMVAHEFRTPLAVINTATELISAASSPESHTVHHNCERIKAASSKMTLLIEQALRGGLLETASWRHNAELVDLKDLLRSALHYGDMISAGQHFFSIDAGNGLKVYGDRELLLTALNNIINNAVKYSAPGTTIQLGAYHKDKGSVCIYIRDQGCGMSEHDVINARHKYYRAESSKGVPGMGLGLYLVDRVMRLHNAKLVIESTPGEGACFTLVIPPPDETSERDTGQP